MIKQFISRRMTLAGLIAFMGLGHEGSQAAAASPSRQERLRKWQCTNQDCEPYIYDPSLGDENLADPDRPIRPGVAFKDLSDDWICPVCNDPKSYFVPLKEWVKVEIRLRARIRP